MLFLNKHTHAHAPLDYLTALSHLEKGRFEESEKGGTSFLRVLGQVLYSAVLIILQALVSKALRVVGIVSCFDIFKR